MANAISEKLKEKFSLIAGFHKKKIRDTLLKQGENVYPCCYNVNMMFGAVQQGSPAHIIQIREIYL